MDLAILHSIQQAVGSPLLDAVLPVLTMLGQAGALWIVVGLALVLSRTYRVWGLALLAALALVGLLDELALKAVIARPRPFLADPGIQLIISPPSGYSFPSGHTGASFAAATVLAASPVHRGWKVFAWVLAILIAFSRLYLYVHYPTDVLAGALLGALYGMLAVLMLRAILRRTGHSSVRGRLARQVSQPSEGAAHISEEG